LPFHKKQRRGERERKGWERRRGRDVGRHKEHFPCVTELWKRGKGDCGRGPMGMKRTCQKRMPGTRKTFEESFVGLGKQIRKKGTRVRKQGPFVKIKGGRPGKPKLAAQGQMPFLQGTRRLPPHPHSRGNHTRRVIKKRKRRPRKENRNLP